MAALHEDMTADEELLNRPLRNPVSPLLSSFKWAADSVASLVDLDPAICVELCKIERAQMHVVALVLAHLEVESTPELGRLLLCGSIRRVITETLGRASCWIRARSGSYACKSIGTRKLSSIDRAS